MAEGSDNQVSRRERRLEMWGGLLGTAAITGIFVFFMLGTACDDTGKCVSRWKDFLTSPANEIGDTFAGFAGALAFLWIVVTVMLQSRELAAQREQLELQRQESKRMADALKDQVEIMDAQKSIFEDEQRQRSEQVADERAGAYVAEVGRKIKKLPEISYVQVPGGRKVFGSLHYPDKVQSLTDIEAIISLADNLARMAKLEVTLSAANFEQINDIISDLIQISDRLDKCSENKKISLRGINIKQTLSSFAKIEARQ